MNLIFYLLIFISFFYAGFQELNWIPTTEIAVSPMQLLTEGMMQSAKDAVELALGLIGIMAFFLGLMKVAEAGGLLKIIARLVRPMMVRLFPDVPADHPAMGAMILNISANALGLGNAATPFGIRAMQELDKLNTQKGTASNAMVLFLAINTSSVTLLPTGVIALRASAGSNDPAGILATTLFATLCSTSVAIVATKFYQRFSPPLSQTNAGVLNKSPSKRQSKSNEGPQVSQETYSRNVSYAALGILMLLIPLIVVYGKTIGPWIVPSLTLILLSFGLLKKVKIYEVFVEGAKEGFQVAIKIIPFLVAILVAIGMLRNSGAMDLAINMLSPITSRIGMPAEALPMALMRPLSGSGAYGLLAETISNPAIGPDSYMGYLVSTLQGSTETTFYVLAVYFGAVQIRKTRHALAAGLTADLAGIIAAVVACTYLYG
ncbi:Spore maturation protein A-like protein [hydrothermal vent metagenome]|uniref:Spore maturation protein A-like protein n=1 Tax=hydrothermal vent metagenome TaxID=652676 RepID=A0A3B1CNZ8_9ZZZZ